MTGILSPHYTRAVITRLPNPPKIQPESQTFLGFAGKGTKDQSLLHFYGVTFWPVQCALHIH